MRVIVHGLYETLYAHPYLALAQGLFTLWMVVDAYRRQAETFWIWVILFLPALGAWAYFFAVKVRDFQGLNLPVLQPRASLDELRYRAEQIPTLANRLALAERLMERKEFAEAVPHLAAAHKQEPFHGQVLYLMALCHTRQGHTEDALPLLQTNIQREPRWGNYAAWLLLIETHDQANNKPAALDSSRELVKLSPLLQHKCVLAEHLLEDGHKSEAQQLLDEALEEQRFAPGPIRRRNRQWAREARRLLKKAGE